MMIFMYSLFDLNYVYCVDLFEDVTYIFLTGYLWECVGYWHLKYYDFKNN